MVRLSARDLGTVVFLFACVPLAFGQSPIVINEIHYDPFDNSVKEEFVELYNTSDASVDVSGWFFSEGFSYTIPDGTEIPPDGYLVVAQDPAVLSGIYGQFPTVGPYDGRLASDGETVTLRDREGVRVDEVDYQVGFPWPTASAGEGGSMELIHPSLDNDLGGSWRTAGIVQTGNPERIYFVEAEDANWLYRKGTSNPPADWKELDFVEDGSWDQGQTSIGYGDGDDNTPLPDMQNGYTSVYFRHRFTIENPEDIPSQLTLGVYVDDGCVIWINGREVRRLHVPGGDLQFNSTANSHDAGWEEEPLTNPGSFLQVGENIIAAHGLNTAPNSSDFSFDIRLFVPAAGEGAIAVPSPGAINSVVSENVPPQIRQVATATLMPEEGRPNVVTAKITDSDGVQSVELHYQVVHPGQYIPAFLPVPIPQLINDAQTPREPNPAFEDPANWTTLTMFDDGTSGDGSAGDDTYGVILPAQDNRRLVRYRITATDTAGNSIRVPYTDDPSLNFGYFVYNGVPDYVEADGTVHRAEDLTAMAVYFLISREEDVVECRADASGDRIPQGTQARFAENWEGTFVHDGYVYDHITYRLRGANGRYQVPSGSSIGKRHWRFKFNKGNHLRARDRFGNRLPRRWRILNTGRMFGNRLDGNWGLNDQVNDVIWEAYGVPAAAGHSFHFRVVDGAEEAPAGPQGQYLGDFWGIARAFENYDVRFLEAHNLPKGNVYKLVNQTRNAREQQRYQWVEAPSNGQDHDNIENSLRSGQSDAWLNAHVDYHKWFHYHALARWFRHYDYWPSANKNACWYFEPVYTAENGFRGIMWTLPFDADATWGPTWNDGQDRPYDAIYAGGGKPELQKDYRSHIREVQDLLWQREQLEQVIRQVAAFIDPLEEADVARWCGAPAVAGHQCFGGAVATLQGKIDDMLRFAYQGGSWPGGGVPAGGWQTEIINRWLSPDNATLPDTPTAEYAGPPGFPVDALTFLSSDFVDPQGADSFGAMMWRIAKITPLVDPGTIPLSDPIWREAPINLELEALWESEELSPFDPVGTIPVTSVGIGKTYRVRVRMKDNTNIWSHWSEPVEFTTGPPLQPIPQLRDLRITEIMYNPVGGADFEFIELQNTGAEVLDLSLVRLRDGVDFDFSESPVTRLNPGEIVLVVRNLEAFSLRYNTGGMLIAGEYAGRLDNAGENITITFGEDLDILNFIYLPEWFPGTDGLGFSLTARAAIGPPEVWNTPEHWMESSVVLGTPGLLDPGFSGGGYVRQGDANLDAQIEISDAFALFLLLFDQQPLGLPCDGEDIQLGSNQILLDSSGDEVVDITDAIYLLSYLFFLGPAPAGGEHCLLLDGCPSVCFSSS